ncbi:MAG: thioredoxin family protein [Gammaproteobacteria bacterium]|nr:thioredoxin family protein [Gammaproteobacteria bacterium]
MVRTPSSMLALGTQAPRFCLNAVQDNQAVTLNERGDFIATVIMFICNHCPYVKHVNTSIIALANDYLTKKVQFIAINSNDASQYPDDSPEHMKQVALDLSYPFPYLYDETQDVAKAYQATCTPDFYVFNKNLDLVYRGQLDDSRPGNQIHTTGASIRTALDALLHNQPIPAEQKASLGCNIKWKQD